MTPETTAAASPLPTADGRGLTAAELARVNRARNEALYLAGRYADDNADPFPAECARVASAVALCVVLALRPTRTPSPFSSAGLRAAWMAAGSPD